MQQEVPDFYSDFKIIENPRSYFDLMRSKGPVTWEPYHDTLMITGFAMQAACSSRPVSGAEHQFSHLWDMEHHTHNGITPSHGFKVGVGSLAICLAVRARARARPARPGRRRAP